MTNVANTIKDVQEQTKMIGEVKSSTSKNELKVPTKKEDIFSLVNGELLKKQMKMVLPKHLTPEKMVRIALTELRRNPKLQTCDPHSFCGAIIRAAQIGLEPSSEKGHIYLIPFKDNKNNTVECQLIIGYKGFLALAAEANVYIESDVIREKDHFQFQKGINTKCEFAPLINGARGEIIGAYAMARVVLPDGTIIYVPEYMNKNDIDNVKNEALRKAYDPKKSPWNTHYEQMARKTPIRRLFKYTPLSSNLSLAAAIDEQADDFSQENAKLFNEILESTEEESANQAVLVSQADELAESLGAA